MIKKSVLSGYTKVDKEHLLGQTIIIKDLIEVQTKEGIAVAVILEDNSYTYLPSADLDFVLNQLMKDEESMNEIRDGYPVTLKKVTSKNNRDYFVMFE